MQFGQKSRSLFPLDRADGFGREVVTHAADTGNLGGDAVGDTLEQRPVDLGHLSGHDVDGVDAADDAGPVIGALALARAGGAEVGHHGKVLPDDKTGLVDLLVNDCVSLAECLEAAAGDGTQAANAQASRGAAVCSMAPAVSLRQWNQVAALDNSPGHRLSGGHRPSGDGPGTVPHATSR